MSARWNALNDDYIRSRYPIDAISDLCYALKRSDSAVRQRAKFLRVRRPHPNDWSADELSYLRAHYAETETATLMKHLGRDYQSVRMQAQRIGLSKAIRGHGSFVGPRGHRTRHTVRHDAFDQWTPVSAYVIGFILGDGCVRSEFRFDLTNTDRLILCRICEAIGSTYPLRQSLPPLGKPCFRVSIYSMQMTTRLIALGVTQRKSLSAILPQVPDAFLGHLVRGYFDADGNVHLHSKGSLSVSFTSGSYALLDSLSQRLADVYGLPVRPVRRTAPSGGAHCITYYSSSAWPLGAEMYRDSGELYMARKRAVFDAFALRRGRTLFA